MRRRRGEGCIENHVGGGFRARVNIGGGVRLSGPVRKTAEEADADRLRLLTHDGRAAFTAEAEREEEARRQFLRVVKRSARHRKLRVYFIQGESGGPIKIGQTTDVPGRLRTLQTSHPERLRVLATCFGGAGEEKELHRQFRHLRLDGEWFRPDETLLAYVAEHAMAERHDGKDDTRELILTLRALADQLEAQIGGTK